METQIKIKWHSFEKFLLSGSSFLIHTSRKFCCLSLRACQGVELGHQLEARRRHAFSWWVFRFTHFCPAQTSEAPSSVTVANRRSGTWKPLTHPEFPTRYSYIIIVYIIVCALALWPWDAKSQFLDPASRISCTYEVLEAVPLDECVQAAEQVFRFLNSAEDFQASQVRPSRSKLNQQHFNYQLQQLLAAKESSLHVLRRPFLAAYTAY